MGIRKCVLLKKIRKIKKQKIECDGEIENGVVKKKNKKKKKNKNRY